MLKARIQWTIWPGLTSVKSRLFSSELSLKRLGWSIILDGFSVEKVKMIKGLTSERPCDKSKISHKGAKKSSKSFPLQTWCWMMKTKKGNVLQWIFHCPFDLFLTGILLYHVNLACCSLKTSQSYQWFSLRWLEKFLFCFVFFVFFFLIEGQIKPGVKFRSLGVAWTQCSGVVISLSSLCRTDSINL